MCGCVAQLAAHNGPQIWPHQDEMVVDWIVQCDFRLFQQILNYVFTHAAIETAYIGASGSCPSGKVWRMVFYFFIFLSSPFPFKRLWSITGSYNGMCASAKKKNAGRENRNRPNSERLIHLGPNYSEFRLLNQFQKWREYSKRFADVFRVSTLFGFVSIGFPFMAPSPPRARREIRSHRWNRYKCLNSLRRP